MGKMKNRRTRKGSVFFISHIDEYKLDDFVENTIDKVFVVIDTIRECYCFHVD